MDRIKWTILVNSLLFLAFVFIAVSALVLWMGFPSGAIFGIRRGFWSDMHVNSGLAFIVLVFAHLWIYRAWIINLPKMLK